MDYIVDNASRRHRRRNARPQNQESSMHTRLIVFGLLLAFIGACDGDAASDDGDEASGEAEERAETAEKTEPEEKPDESPEPRVNETDTPDDDAIGALPEGMGIPPGESAPDVVAVDAEGDEIQLLDLVEDEAIVLFFYRGGWCPYCSFQIREMTEAFDDFDDRGVRPVAISVDRPEEAAQTDATFEIPFPVLSDSDLVVHEAFSVVYEADEDEVDRLAGFGMDIEQASGRDHNSYAIPGVFVIDDEAVVQWAHVDPDYSVRPSTDQLLDVVDELFD